MVVKPWREILLFFKINILFCLLTSLSTTAQIVPDKTLPVNSNVTNQGNISVINGGTPAGNNLFHSFEKFSIPTGSTAHFNNSIDIQNIISRVTSESISNIDGLIRANGTANLFLLNPNGIIFGPNASLNIGGSFLASTASSMDFADGTQFSAKTPQTKPLLIVSVPIGLQFGSNPGGIHLQGTGHKLINPDVYPVIRNTTSTGLHVQPGKTLALVGGNVTLNGGTLMAEGGRIELGSVGGDGLVSISPTTSGWTLSYQGTQNFQNIHLSHQSLADASGVGGSIQVQGRNVKLTDSSVILIQNQGLLPSGTLSLNASEHLEISGINPVTTIIGGLRTETQSIFGNGGDIVISAPRLFVQDGNRITTRTYGISKAGNIIVNAPNSVQLSGASPIDPRALSNIASLTLGFGKAGDITVSTGQFVVTGGASVSSVTYGIGSGGNVILNTTGSVEVIGFEPRILAPSNLAATTLYDGKAGTLEIYTSNLRVWDGGRITSSTFAKGNAGSVTIYAKESVEVSGTVPGSVNSSLVDSSAQVVDKTLQQVAGLPPVPSGNSGDVTINTERLSVTNGGQISVRNDGPGNAGILEINANSINLDEQGSVTALTRGVNSKGGNIDIDTNLLVAFGNSYISADAENSTAGQVFINTQGLFLWSDRTITANSGAGPQFNGIVQINTPEVDPSRGLVALPVQPVDVTGLIIAQGCLGGTGSTSSKFVVTGNGGIPLSPTDSLYSHRGWHDNSFPAQLPQNSQEPEKLATATATDPTPLVEAQGWRQNPDGTITLTAEPTGSVPYASLGTPSCYQHSSLKIPPSSNAVELNK